MSNIKNKVARLSELLGAIGRLYVPEGHESVHEKIRAAMAMSEEDGRQDPADDLRLTLLLDETREALAAMTRHAALFDRETDGSWVAIREWANDILARADKERKARSQDRGVKQVSVESPAMLRRQRDLLLKALLEARPYVPDHHGPVTHLIEETIRNARP